jgi:methylated-DNA-[protein]-cysteine S-methyltransferase
MIQNQHFFSTPMGWMSAEADTEGICKLAFCENDESKIPSLQTTDLPYLIAQLIEQLDKYFNGTRKEFTLPLSFKGTPFQISVWKELLTIPYGATRTYMEQSLALNNPLGIRAVAKANGANPIAILVPCHRVVGSDGKLTGYAGGISRKKWLLNHELNNTPFSLY